MPIESISLSALPSAHWQMPWVADLLFASTEGARGSATTTAPPAPVPTEDLGLQALMRDWIVQALTESALLAAPPLFAPSGLPLGGGLALESLASAYDYDNFAGNRGPTTSDLLPNGEVIIQRPLDLLV